MACTAAVTKANVCVCLAGAESDVTCYLATHAVRNTDNARTEPASAHRAGMADTALYVCVWFYIMLM